MLDANDLTNRLLAAEESKSVTLPAAETQQQDEVASKFLYLHKIYHAMQCNRESEFQK